MTVPLGRTRFETELRVRPDDLDMNRHVHVSRYLDYVLAARYDQMERCYHMSMEEFLQAGFGWVVSSCQLDFKRALGLGERFTVRTWIEEFFANGVQVNFEIDRQKNHKRCCDGCFHYTLVSLRTGRSEPIPDWIMRKYAI